MNRLSVEEAAAQIIAAVAPLPSESVPLRDALGRVLARDVLSPVTLPPWDNSSMDGYAVRSSDVQAAGTGSRVMLDVLETVAAGSMATQPVRPGTAIRIMTGAPIPEGADTVIRVEDTDAGVHRVEIRDNRDAGRNVRPRGEDLRAGGVAVAAGTLLGPGAVGVLASVGAARVEVHRAPRVAVLTSGDELVDVGSIEEVRRGTRIVSSNSYSIGAAVRLAGGEPMDLGIARDDPAVLRAALERARGADLVITTGGVSVGAFDFTREVVSALGAEMKFWRVRMRPGAPVSFGMIGDTPWLGLPGNPVSALVTFELFARPAIRRMRGESRPYRRPVRVTVDEPVTINAPLTHFLRAVVSRNSDDQLFARLTGPQGSGLLTSMARANALLVIPPERQQVPRGEQVMALLLGDDVESSAELRLT